MVTFLGGIVDNAEIGVWQVSFEMNIEGYSWIRWKVLNRICYQGGQNNCYRRGEFDINQAVRRDGSIKVEWGTGTAGGTSDASHCPALPSDAPYCPAQPSDAPYVPRCLVTPHTAPCCLATLRTALRCLATGRIVPCCLTTRFWNILNFLKIGFKSKKSPKLV